MIKYRKGLISRYIGNYTDVIMCMHAAVHTYMYMFVYINTYVCNSMRIAVVFGIKLHE